MLTDNESLFLPQLRFVTSFFAFAYRFEARVTDHFDQDFRRDRFVVGDDCFARHDVHSHFAHASQRLERPLDQRYLFSAINPGHLQRGLQISSCARIERDFCGRCLARTTLILMMMMFVVTHRWC